MDVAVASRLGKAISRRISGSAVVGNSMLVRLRSGTIGLVGLAAAIGLGLVALASEQGLPDVSSGPLPQRPPTPFVHHQTIAMPTPKRFPVASFRQARATSGSPAHAPTVAYVPPPAESTPTVPSQGVGAPDHKHPTSHPPTSHPSKPATSEQPQPAPPSTPAPGTTATPAEAEPPPAEPPAAVASQTGESSPGHSGEPHGHAPPWAGHDQSSTQSHSSSGDQTHSYAPSFLPSYTPQGTDHPSDGDGGGSGGHDHERGYSHGH